MSIYEAMKNAGVRIESHCSDMYVPKNTITDKILSDYGGSVCAKVFRDNIDHELWYDIAFAYEPYWKECERGRW